MSDYVYLYGFVPADAPAPQSLAGVADRAVQLVSAGQLTAAVSHVPATQYAPDVVEQRLQDLQWVAEQGLAHERVVAWFVDHGEILPAPLFTMYSSVAALSKATAERSQQLLAETQRLRGLREWDLKISFDARVVQQHAAQVSEKVAQLDDEISSAPAGKRYLLQKKRSDLIKVEIRQAAHRKAVEVLNALHESTVQTRTLPIPRADDSLPVVLHAALLVRTEQERDLAERLQTESAKLRAIGMELTFSGPWAPYRFMGDDEQ